MRWASGFASGVVALVAAELVVWGVAVAAPYRDAYRDFQAALPALSRFALSPGWIFGLSAVLVVATSSVNIWRRGSERSRAIGLATLAVVALCLAVATVYAGVYPSLELAGHIAAE